MIYFEKLVKDIEQFKKAIALLEKVSHETHPNNYLPSKTLSEINSFIMELQDEKSDEEYRSDIREIAKDVYNEINGEGE